MGSVIALTRYCMGIKKEVQKEAKNSGKKILRKGRLKNLDKKESKMEIPY